MGPNIDSWGTPHFKTGFRCGAYFNIFFLASYKTPALEVLLNKAY